jgi:hypothetical protein
MTLINNFRRLAAEVRAIRAHNETIRSIRALPREIQKDIGWPEAYRETQPRTIVDGWF